MAKKGLEWNLDDLSGEAYQLWRLSLWNLSRSSKAVQPFIQKQTDDLKLGLARLESPIEVRLFIAIMGQNWGTNEKPILASYCHTDTDFASSTGRVRVSPQCSFFGRRMDIAMAFSRVGSPHFVAVEADGKDYHHAFVDNKRDSELLQLGVHTIRFPGSEIYSDPIGCIGRLNSFATLLENGGVS